MEAVGYDMYCKMLHEAVRLLKGETKEADFVTTLDVNVDAYIPDSYIPNEYQKLDIYKRIAAIETEEEKEDMIEELTDRLKRSMAEFDNYRKRTEKEKSAMYEIGAKDIIEKLLPVVDNFERGLAAVPEGEKTVFADGMDMIYRQLMKMLEDAGVKPIEAAGQPFDPNFHNAVMHVEDESLGENIIAEEFQKGYLYRDSVIRHSMVKVAN